MTLCNTNPEAADHMKSMFGGYRIDVDSDRYRKDLVTHPTRRWSIARRWWTTGPSVFNVLRILLPYLKLKRQQAELLLAHEKIITKIGPRSTDEKDVLVRLAEMNASFNSRKGPKKARFQ